MAEPDLSIAGSAKEAIAPPGWEGTVKHMKKEKKIENPWALAWSMKNKGFNSHIKSPKKSALLLKRALDQVNIELDQPTYEPRAEFDRQDSPFYSKGLEDNYVKSGSFESMPKEFKGSLADLGKLALHNGYKRAVGTKSKVNFRKRIEESDFDYDIEYKLDNGVYKMVGGEVRVKYEFAPDITTFIRKAGSKFFEVAKAARARKIAEIEMHESPKKLPPRYDLRRRLDEDVKEEINEDPDLDINASKTARSYRTYIAGKK